MGDVVKAKRDLMFARMAVESQRWDELGEQMKKVQVDLDGLSDAEKAPLLTEMTAIKTETSKAIEEDVTRRLDRAAKAEGSMVTHELNLATKRLDSDEAQNFLEPALMEQL